MIRCSDFRGEKELRGAMSLRCCRIVAREAGWKILDSVRRVIRRVLDGGAGVASGGRDPRSSERGERERFLDNEEGGEEFDCDRMFVMWVSIGDGEGCSARAMMAVWSVGTKSRSSTARCCLCRVNEIYECEKVANTKSSCRFASEVEGD